VLVLGRRARRPEIDHGERFAATKQSAIFANEMRDSFGRRSQVLTRATPTRMAP
jgi:hypothetical protein